MNGCTLSPLTPGRAYALKKPWFIALQIVSLILFFPLVRPSVAVAGGLSDPDSSSVSDLVSRADILTEKEFRHEEALQLFEQALEIEPDNADILWKISRVYVEIGEHLPVETDEQQNEQLKTYEKAFEYADRAVKADSTNSMAYTRRAIANGRIALFKGVWDSIDLVKSVKKDLENALRLDGQNDVAYYVLGRTHAKVAEKPGIFRWPLGLSWASYEDAIMYYQKAIDLKPDVIMYRLDFARAYVEEDEYEKAREQLAMIETLQNSDQDDDDFRSEAKELLKEIEDE